jgi:hypothetical protein
MSNTLIVHAVLILEKNTLGSNVCPVNGSLEMYSHELFTIRSGENWD